MRENIYTVKITFVIAQTATNIYNANFNPSDIAHYVESAKNLYIGKYLRLQYTDMVVLSNSTGDMEIFYWYYQPGHLVHICGDLVDRNFNYYHNVQRTWNREGLFKKEQVASLLIQCCVFQFTKYYTATVMSQKEGGMYIYHGRI